MHAGTLVELDDGRRLTLAPTTPIDFGDWRPDELARNPNEQETAHVVASLPERNDKGTFSVFCLSPTEDLFVSGCADGTSLVACAGQDAVLLAPGGRPRAKAWFTRHAAGSIGFACLWLMIPLLCAWLPAAHLRAVTRTLGDHALGRPPRKSTFLVVVIMIAVGALANLVLRITPLWDNLYGPLVGLALSLSLASIVVLRLLKRIGVVSSALRVVSQTETSALDAMADGAIREIAVRVPADAATRPAPDGSLATLIRVQLDATPPLDLPRRIPIEDGSSRGILDMERAVLDDAPKEMQTRPLRDIRVLLASVGATTTQADDLIGARPETYEHKGKTRLHTYTTSWWVLAPGASLLIYGDLERVLPEKAGVAVAGDAGYRDAPTVPLVHGGEHGMIVYVGAEEDLRLRLRRERTFTVIAGPMFLGVLLTCVGLATFVLR